LKKAARKWLLFLFDKNLGVIISPQKEVFVHLAP
jgi:hypothetical protein